MAYITQEEKRTIAPVVKKILKKYGQKGTLSIRHHSSLVLKLKDVAGMFTPYVKDDFVRKWGLDVNPYHYQNHYKCSPEVVQMLDELFTAMKGENYFNNDDPMTDYFHRKHYVDIFVFGPDGGRNQGTSNLNRQISL